MAGVGMIDLDHDLDDETTDEESEADVQEASEVNIPGAPNNLVLRELTEQEDNELGIEPHERAFQFGNMLTITVEDTIIYRSIVTWANSVDPKFKEVCKASRLFVLIRYALYPLNNRDGPIELKDVAGNDAATAGNIWQDALETSMDPKSWYHLYKANEKDMRALSKLFRATARINLKNGEEIGGGQKPVNLMNELRGLYPEYYLCFLCAKRVNECTMMIQGREYRIPDKDQLFPVQEVTVWDILGDPDFGLMTAGSAAIVELNTRRQNGLRGRTIRYVIDRLCTIKETLEEMGSPQSVFSRIAPDLRTNFPTEYLDTGLDPENIGYGSCENKNAMLSLMLACCELEIIRSCASLVKTMIMKMPGARYREGDIMIGNEQELAAVAGVLLGYKIDAALSNPSTAEYAPLVYSRISTTNLGSLAAVWLATNEQYTYEKLLTAGDPDTQAFNAYSRVCPFVQAVLMRSAEQTGGYHAKAIVTCEQVREVFSQYALMLVQVTPGHTEVGTSKVITEVDQQLVTTLFYGALSSDIWFAGRESLFLARLLQEDLGHEVGGNAKQLDLAEGILEI